MPDPRHGALRLINQLSDEELRLFARLVAVLAAPKLVRTERLELVDRQGRVRAVLGNLAGAAEPGDYYPGLALRSPEGGDRATLVVHDTGPLLGFTLEGNDALVLGVDDPASAEVRGETGPYVELVGRTGTWRASERGIEEERTGNG